MRIKNGFELKEICGENIVISNGLDNIDFSKIVSLNNTATFLWNNFVGQTFTVDDFTAKLYSEYEVDEATARADAEKLLKEWMEIGLVE